MTRLLPCVLATAILAASAASVSAEPTSDAAFAQNPEVIHSMPFGIELVSATPAFSGDWPQASSKVSGTSVKNDDGTHIKVTFLRAAGDQTTGYEVYRHPGDAKTPLSLTYSYYRVRGKATNAKLVPTGAWQSAKQIVDPGGDAKDVSITDTVPPRAAHSYAVLTYRTGEGPSEIMAVSEPALLAAAVSPKAGWFNTTRWFFLFVIIAMAVALYAYIAIVRKDPEGVFIRRIAGVDAIEEAVGRSTEMGRPVLYVTGVEEIQNIQTIASLLVLGRVAEMTAEYDTELKVANFFPLTMVVAEEIVKQGYANAGRIDAHKPENVMFVSAEQFAFAAGVNGMILRDRPACNIYLGRFFAESLILAETGYVTKAIQIAGTAEITQLPFFIAACDYTIIGEELYAVSAYLSREPNLLAQLKASDLLKVGILAIVLIGSALSLFDVYNLGAFLLP